MTLFTFSVCASIAFKVGFTVFLDMVKHTSWTSLAEASIVEITSYCDSSHSFSFPIVSPLYTRFTKASINLYVTHLKIKLEQVSKGSSGSRQDYLVSSNPPIIFANYGHSTELLQIFHIL